MLILIKYRYIFFLNTKVDQNWWSRYNQKHLLKGMGEKMNFEE